MIWIISIIWLVIGFCSFVYWWRVRYDFHLSDVPTALFFSVLGPIAFILCWILYGTDRIILRKYERKE